MNASTDPRSIRVAVSSPTTRGNPHPQQAESPVAHAAPVGHAPLIDIHEGPDGLVLEADLPGATEDGLTIQLEDNVLTLQATVEAPAPKGSLPLHEEYRVGPFQRSFILSEEVERGRITAELKDGVLRVHLPKAERAKTRRIEIKTS